jgi:hypothetical protein
VLALCASTGAIPIVFLSDKGFGQGATIDSPTITIRPNEVHELHVWVKTDIHTLVTVDLDLFQSDGGLEFLDATVHQPSSSGPSLGTHRWVFADVAHLTPEFIQGMLGSTTPTFGHSIGPFYEDHDTLFDPDVGAFLFASVDYSATRVVETELFLAIGRNTFNVNTLPFPNEISLGVGDEPVANREGSMSKLPDATIRVVPEPQSVLLASLGVATLIFKLIRR